MVKSSTYILGEEIHIFQFYEVGNIKEKSTFTNLKRNEKFETRHENGQLQLVVEFVENLHEGNWKVYDQTGQMIGSAAFY